MSRVQAAQDRAAQWIVAREEPGWNDAAQADLDAWLGESDLNRVAFIRLEHSWREADRIGSLGPSITPESMREPEERTLGRARQWWMPMAAAASLVMALGFGWYQFGPSRGSGGEQVASTRYDTKLGARETVRLSDGSKVELNTASVVRTAVSQNGREVWLDQGEAYFEIAHDKTRPFVVHAGNRQVTVLGTKFSVRRDGDNVTVYVREGRVRVDDIEGSQTVRSTTITGGDIALTRGSATLVTGKSDERVDSALAWRTGMLNFDQDRLVDVAGEFNRYNSRKLVITDSAAGNIRIGGMFPATKPGDFAHLLRDAYGLKIEETPEEIRISN